MKVAKILLVVLVAAAAVVAIVAPIGPVPGFFIGGTQAAVPASWADTSDVHEIKLKVGGGILPRVVIIWVVQVDGQLYVVGAKGSGWTQRIASGGSVEMRLGDNRYALQAEPVTDWEPIIGAYVAKYEPDYPEIIAGFPKPEDGAPSPAVFRLSAP